MKVVLVVLPWSDYRAPQAAMGSLAAYLKQEEPHWDVNVVYSYLDVAVQDHEMYRAIAVDFGEGDRLFAAILYPEGAPALIKSWDNAVESTAIAGYIRRLQREGKSAQWIYDTMRRRIEAHLDALVDGTDWNETVVGLTTGYGQLFGNILLAQRIKQRAPSAVVVVGGSTVSPAGIADSMLATYPCIDAIVRGEGELPLHALASHVEKKMSIDGIRGVVTRSQPAAVTQMWQVEDMDRLPIPNFDGYFNHPFVQAFDSHVPIEGSRGCWWDRTAKNETSTCHFCNLNVQWDGDRQKSAQRVASEHETQARRYQRARFTFLDNIVRVKGFPELMDELGKVDVDTWMFHEARANMRPYDILRFAEVGLRSVQFGVEALSNGVLDKINQGTSVIMSLEVMKTCAELHIDLLANLIVHFPSTTEDDVTETLEVINEYAWIYPPPDSVAFVLGIDSVVYKHPERYGVSNVRSHDMYRGIVPEAVLAQVQLYDYTYDVDLMEQADWNPVIARVLRWKAEYGSESWLRYEETGGHLRIVRSRPTGMQTYVLRGAKADLYRYCMQIRTQSELGAEFPNLDPVEREALLEEMVAQRIMFREKARYLSLAVARDAMIAARRILKQHVADEAKIAAGRPKRSPTPMRLPMVR